MEGIREIIQFINELILNDSIDKAKEKIAAVPDKKLHEQLTALMQNPDYEMSLFNLKPDIALLNDKLRLTSWNPLSW